MMAQLSGSIASQWWFFSSNPLDQETPYSKLDRKFQQNFMNGTGDFQINQKFSNTRSLAASTSEDLDLNNAANPLLDAHGRPLQLTKLKGIRVVAALTNVNNVVIGGAPSNGFLGWFSDISDKIALPPGGFFEIVHPAAGWTVTPGSGDLLRLANSGAGSAVGYDIGLIGVE